MKNKSIPEAAVSKCTSITEGSGGRLSVMWRRGNVMGQSRALLAIFLKAIWGPCSMRLVLFIYI